MPLRRYFGAVVACALLLPGPTALAGPGVVCKRVNEQGVTEYKNMPRCGNGWVVAAQYQPDPVAPPPPAAPQAVPIPPPGTAPVPDAPPLANAAPGAGPILQDFGDPNAAAVLALLRSGAGGAHFSYLQIGDSHTAGDFLTERLRLRLQQLLGDGGIGWVTPIQIPGQRLARITVSQTGWQLISSRTSGPGYDYPFGGFIAQMTTPFAMLTLKPRYATPRQAITLLIRQGPMDAPLTVTDASGRRQTVQSPYLDSQWHPVAFEADLPITVSAAISPQTAIGGWWMQSANGRGAVVSAVGINGSELEQWNRWRNGWMDDLAPARPDLVALAYGTNEAFRTTLDPETLRSTLTAAVTRLRQRFPGGAILILGAPESLKSGAGQCGVRAVGLDAVQAVQRAVAQQQHTLYWDWQQAMGGQCSMTSWMARGLARRDGVHFSREGYEALADNLFSGLNQQQ